MASSSTQRIEEDSGKKSKTIEKKSLGIIASKGTLDMAYPPLILASAARALDWDVFVFFTFWGLDIIHKDKTKNLKIAQLAIPNLGIPNLVGVLPGMTKLTNNIMKKRMKNNNVVSLDTLLNACIEAGVDLMACEMTANLMEYSESDFIEGVKTGVGAATAIDRMADCDIQLFI